jgi:hypothetical protein
VRWVILAAAHCYVPSGQFRTDFVCKLELPEQICLRRISQVIDFIERRFGQSFVDRRVRRVFEAGCSLALDCSITRLVLRE